MIPVIDIAAQHLAPWESFYVIVGSSGAALIGIQFVVIALVADAGRIVKTADAIGAFATPTVVHLGGALIISAVMSAPWPSLFGVASALALCGLGGLGYGAVVIAKTRRQTDYQPVHEDWIWHAMLPCGCYATLAVAAFLLPAAPMPALFATGAAALGLLLVGIHNAWDSVTYVVASSVRLDAPSIETKKGTGSNETGVKKGS